MSEFLRHTLSAPLPRDKTGAVIAIGNFDGVHRGHQVVLNAAIAQARSAGRAAYVLSFEPHPRTLFKPQSPVFRLTDEETKADVLKAYGLDGLLTLPFTRELASTPADEFVDDILLDHAGGAHMVIGFNFMFGKDRQGSPDFLQDKGEQRDFGVTVVPEFSGATDSAISSSRIRRLLGAGEVRQAADLLGYHWMVTGTVQTGAQLGRTLGYPTANLSLPASCHLAHGIYAVMVRLADGSRHFGVASYGRRPTFDNGDALLETFIFDYSGELYGETITITLVEFLRGEEKFASAEALVAQMDRDSAQAKAVLAAIKPVSPLDAALHFEPGKAEGQ